MIELYFPKNISPPAVNLYVLSILSFLNTPISIRKSLNEMLLYFVLPVSSINNCL